MNSSNILSMYAVMLAVVAILVAVTVWARPRIVAALSRLVDRYHIRPSIIDACFVMMPIVYFGLVLIIIRPNNTPAPGLVLTIVLAAILACILGFVIQTVRNPPEIEYRPHWYIGEGDPKWVRWRRGMKWSGANQFSLSWLLITLTTFCLLLGTQGERLAGERRARHLHRLAVNRLADLNLIVKDSTLNLFESELNNDDLRIVLGHKDIKHVYFRSGANDETLRMVGEFRQLRSLVLMGTAITDEGLAHLAGMTELTMLRLNHTAITDRGLEHLGRMRELIDLGLGDTKISDAGLLHLSNLDSLQTLRLENTSINGTGLAVIANRKPFNPAPKDWKLMSLWLNGCRLSEAGLREVVRVKPSMLVLDKTEAVSRIVATALPEKSINYTHPNYRSAPRILAAPIERPANRNTNSQAR